jgi:hypothetical protein
MGDEEALCQNFALLSCLLLIAHEGHLDGNEG